MTSRFVMQKEPVKPRRSSVHFSHWLEEGSLLKNIGGLAGVIRNGMVKGYDWVNEGELVKRLDKIYLTDESSSYYSNYNCLTIDLPETDASYEANLVAYEAKLKNYKEWRKKNTAAIEQHEKAERERKAASKAKADKRAAEERERRKKDLQKLLQNTQQKLEKLTKET